MTKGIAVANISNWENEDWFVYKDRDVSPGALVTAVMPPPGIRLAPGESTTFHDEYKFILRIMPVVNDEADAKHVDHDGLKIDVLPRQREEKIDYEKEYNKLVEHFAPFVATHPFMKPPE